MLSQPWLHDPHWDRKDHKLGEAAEQPLRLPHTRRLAGEIPLRPAGFLLLRGPRQVGKSTFLREFAVRCLREGIEPENLISCDAEKATHWQQLSAVLEAFLSSRRGYTLILIDELTAVAQWWLAIKSLADQGMSKDSLILGTGSSAEDLAQGADLLPGRRGRRYPVDFEMLPVPFSMVRDRLGLSDYLLTGGFPWAINEFLRLGFIPPYVYALQGSVIAGSFLKKRTQAASLGVLLRYLASHQGSPISVTSLARDCGMGSNHTGEEYLELLDLIYALLPCRWAEPGKKVPVARKNRKFYAADPLLFHVFSQMGTGWDDSFESARERLLDPALVGKMVEGLVAAELRRRNGNNLRYWLGDREIDFIGDSFIEVKYQNHVSPAEFAWALKVMPKGKRLTVVTKETRADLGNVHLVPLVDWLCEPSPDPGR
jgi:uncharacterized protein